MTMANGKNPKQTKVAERCRELVSEMQRMNEELRLMKVRLRVTVASALIRADQKKIEEIRSKLALVGPVISASLAS